MWVIFATDALLFGLLVVILVGVWFSRHHETLRAPWREVGRRPLAMVSAMILSVYALIALLDSVHFYPTLPAETAAETPRYMTEVHSVLDLMLTPLRMHTETSYSAPFASHAVARSLMEQEDGSQQRGYARLRWGGAHLLEPETETVGDVLRRTGRGAVTAMAVYVLFLLGALLLLSHGHVGRCRELIASIFSNRLQMPWRAMLLTGLVLTALFGATAALAHHYHILGTDKVGQDVLYQCLKSIRTGIVIGTLTTVLMMPFAVLLGLLSGYFRTWVDDVIQYLYTTLNSIPGVLLIAAGILLLQLQFTLHPDVFNSTAVRADMRLLCLCLILGITSWTGLCRLLRGEALKLREMDYVQAARVLGVSRFRIIAYHLLPNVMHILIISIVLDFSALVLAEAVLSYVNIGVDPTTYSWGNMINSARLEMSREPVIWWSLGGALFFMLVLVLAANLFADAVRDAFDPRLRLAVRP